MKLKKSQRLKYRDFELGYFDDEIGKHAAERLQNEYLTDDLIHDLLLYRLDQKIDAYKRRGIRGMKLSRKIRKTKRQILRSQEYYIESFIECC